jgi:hypothetical protein
LQFIVGGKYKNHEVLRSTYTRKYYTVFLLFISLEAVAQQTRIIKNRINKEQNLKVLQSKGKTFDDFTLALTADPLRIAPGEYPISVQADFFRVLVLEGGVGITT